ncbi:hypothetical protein ACF0H5_009793 [Mactra antiquata]
MRVIWILAILVSVFVATITGNKSDQTSGHDSEKQAYRLAHLIEDLRNKLSPQGLFRHDREILTKKDVPKYKLSHIHKNRGNHGGPLVDQASARSGSKHGSRR